MTKKEVVQKIVEKIAGIIESHGFKTDLKNYWFVRKTDAAGYIYDIHFYDRTNTKTGAKGFLVEPYIWINVKEIEQYYKEITLNKELKKETDFKILGESLAELIANRDGIHRKWNESLDLYIFEERDIAVVAKELIKQFEKVALPYFLKNGSVQMVDKLANEHPKEKSVHLSNDNHRIIHGLIAAKLNNNTKLEQLIEIYDKMIIELDMVESTREEMDRLKSILPMIGSKLSLNKRSS